MDFAFSKVFLVGAVALLVIGPKDLPRAARWLGRMVGKLSAMRDQMRSQLDEALKEPMQAAREARFAMDQASGEVHQALDQARGMMAVGEPLPSSWASRGGSVKTGSKSPSGKARKAKAMAMIRGRSMAGRDSSAPMRIKACGARR